MAFTGTPPLDLDNTQSGGWGSNWKLYRRSYTSGTVVRYGLYQISNSSFAGSGAAAYDSLFSINSSNQLEFSVDAGSPDYNPHSFKVGSSSTTIHTTPTTVNAGDTIYIYDSTTGGNNTNYDFKFDVPSELAVTSGSGGGSTQTYVRTPHTGTILSSTQRRINRPDYDTTLTVGGLRVNEDYYFRKIGNHKVRLRWNDQNESPTYVASAYVEISSGVYDQYTLGVQQGTGDVQWDLDTSNGSGHSGFNPNNLSVMHNGKIFITFSDDVYFQGNSITAGNTVKEWTYLGVGPFSASFTPLKAKEGEQVTLGFKDDNPFPDSPYGGSYEGPDGTSADMFPNDPAFGNVNPYTLQVYAQKGHYKIYEADITHRGSQDIIAYHKFVRGGKVNSNFW